MQLEDRKRSGAQNADLVARSDAVLLHRYAPAGVIVNHRLEILRFIGRTAPYLQLASGAPQNNLLNMARAGLRDELRMALLQASEANVAVRRSAVRPEVGAKGPTCDLVVIPVTSPPAKIATSFAVMFELPAAQRSLAPGNDSTEGAQGGRAR